MADNDTWVVLTKDGYIFTKGTSTVELYVDTDLKNSLKRVQPPHMDAATFENQFIAHRPQFIAHYRELMSRSFGQGDLVAGGVLTQISRIDMYIPPGFFQGKSDPKGVEEVTETVLRSYGSGWIVNPTYTDYIRNCYNALPEETLSD